MWCSGLNYLVPKKNDSFIVACESCGAILNFSKSDLYYFKEAEICRVSGKDRFQNIARIFVDCPNCGHRQDVAGGFRFYEDMDHFHSGRIPLGNWSLESGT